MLSIEEAWAALEERCGQRMKLDKDAARALALSVLEEMSDPELGLCCPGDAAFVADLRARIEALGR